MRRISLAAAVAGAFRRSARRSTGGWIACAHRSRSFAAAATALEEPAYWTDWEEEGERESARRRQAPEPAADSCGDRSGRGIQWVFMGSPGAQKHVYATSLAELMDVPYISMGTLVRQELNPRSALYKKIANSVNEGKLVPEDIIFGLLSKRLEEGYYRGETGFILDGIPRTQIQAEILDLMVEIDLVVNFKSMDDRLVKKRFGCDMCMHCGKSFDAGNPESTSLNPCVATCTRHAKIIASAAVDLDDPRVEKARVYSEQSKLLEDYYRKQNKLLNFEASGGPGENWQGLLAALRIRHVDAATLPHKLTV